MSNDLLGKLFHQRFMIRERIGEGGWATVYQATDTTNDTEVAVKILNPAFLSRRPREADRNVRRFLREGEIIKLLSGSPHVVGYIDHGQAASGEHFIAMELLVGEQLRHYMGRGASLMDSRRLVRFGIHLCEGLREIHNTNILHRDLAPDNVIVVERDDGELVPKYVDFGIGKSLAGGLDEVTQMLTIMGKPEYFSPEQARGEELTAKSDVYSLGVLLYEMVTGLVPIRMQGGIRSTKDLIALQRNPPSPIDEQPGGTRVPVELRDTIMRCLHKTPNMRPAVEELLLALNAALPLVDEGGDFPEEAHTEVITLGGPPARRRDTRSQNTLDDFKAGYLFKSRYEIKELLGRGGMGAVYRAYDQVLSRDTALKIHTEIHDSEAKDAILQEAKASASLDRCPNIVTIYDAGSHDGVPYIAMEFVEGQTLRDMIDALGGVTGETFWSLAQGICEGLKFAHEQPMRVIHRDLKPSNIMVTPAGVPKIADFGIAKVIGRMGGEDEAKTLVASAGSSALGTAATMSPEQAENHSVDERSDIYSLGCVLYWMATGRPPFVGDPISILVQHSTRSPDPPTSINPMLTDKRAERIILKCLEKAPDQRYQTAGELLADINEVIASDRRTRVPWYRSAAAIVIAFGAMAIAVYFTRPGGDDGGDSSEANLRSRAPHAVDGQAYLEGAHYFVGEAGPKILLGGSASRSDLMIEVRSGEDEEEHLVAKGSAFATIPLPKSILEGVPYEIVGREGAEERFRFQATLDKSPPRVFVGTAGRPFEEIKDELLVIDEASIRFRFEDDGVGFDSTGTRLREASLQDLLADGTTSRNSLTSAKRLSEDLLEITARDFLSNGQEQRRLRIKKQVLQVVLADPEKLPRYVASRMAFAFSLSADGFNLNESPLPGDVTVTDSEQWISEAIAFKDGRYLVDVPLPDPGPLGHMQRELSIQYRGRILPLGGDAASIPIVQSTTAPDLILLHQPRGAAERAFRTQDLGREPIELSQTEQIADTLRLRILRDSSAPVLPCTVEWDADGSTFPLEIGPDGFIRLPDVTLDADSEPKRYLVRARDVAGNSTHMEVFLKRGAFEVATHSIGDAMLLEGWDGFAFRLRAGGPLPLVAHVNGIGDELYAKLAGADASEPVILKLDATQSSERRGTLVLPELKENEDLRLTLSYHRRATGDDRPLRVETVTLDGAAPIVSISVPMYTETSSTPLVFPSLPELRMDVQEFGGLPLGEPSLPEAIAKLYDLRREPRDNGWSLHFIPKNPAIAWETEGVSIPIRDFHGRVGEGRIPSFRVVPHQFVIASIQGVPVDADQPIGHIPVGADGLSIVLDSLTASPRAALRARIRRAGELPISLILQNLTPKGQVPVRIPPDKLGEDGELFIEWRDTRWTDEQRYAEIPVARFRYRMDRADPAWDLMIGDEKVGAASLLRAEVGTEAVLILRDDGGFGTSPLKSLLSGGIPASLTEAPAKFPGELRYRLPVGTSVEGTEWDLLATDAIGRSARIQITIKPFWNTPRLTPFTGPSGRVLPTRGDSTFLRELPASLFASAPNQDRPQPLTVTVLDADETAIGSPLQFLIPPNGRTEINLRDLASERLVVQFAGETGIFETRSLILDQLPPTITASANDVAIDFSTPTPVGDLHLKVADDGCGLLSLEARLGDHSESLLLPSGGIFQGQLPAELVARVAKTGDTLLLTAVDRLGNESTASIPLLGLDFTLLTANNFRDTRGRPLLADAEQVLWTNSSVVNVQIPEFPLGTERMTWRIDATGEEGQRSKDSQSTPVRFDLADGAPVNIRWEWIAAGGKSHSAGTFTIVRESTPPILLPEQPDLISVPGGIIEIVAKDDHSGLRSLTYEIGGRKLTEQWSGTRSATVRIKHPGSLGHHNLICTLEDLAGHTLIKSYVVRTEAPTTTVRLSFAEFAGGFVPLPPSDVALEIARTEMDLGSFRSFHRATESDNEFWVNLPNRMVAVDRKLSARHSSEEGLQLLREAVRGVIARNQGMPDQHPARFASDDVASVCAAYYGARLPTVAEWRAAARGAWDNNLASASSVFPVLAGGELTTKNARTFNLHVKRRDNKPLAVDDAKDDITREGVLCMAGNVREIVQLYDFAFRVVGGSWRTELNDIGSIAEASASEDVGFRIIRKRKP